jgi:hypothetical protein
MLKTGGSCGRSKRLPEDDAWKLEEVLISLISSRPRVAGAPAALIQA